MQGLINPPSFEHHIIDQQSGAYLCRAKRHLSFKKTRPRLCVASLISKAALLKKERHQFTPVGVLVCM